MIGSLGRSIIGRSILVVQTRLKRPLVMPVEPYLLRLGARLTAGLAGLSADSRARHQAFVLSRQNSDGGFSGREGGSDLYYTAFAVRSLAVLGVISAADAENIARYLQSCQRMQVTVIDLVSWLYCALVVQAAAGIDVLAGFDPDWPARLAGILESFRTQDGGYAKTHEGALGSTYHSFLVALCYELIGQPLPQPGRLMQFVFDRQRDDGGFVEIAPMKRSGTNPTAAAAALLKIHGALDRELRDDVAAFLREVRSAEGGFQANTRIPFADGLSTFTGLLTVQDLELPDLVDPPRVVDFVRALELPGGGFRGASWDEVADVEYTFYALGTLGLVDSATSGR
jgi:geranylgeranyl transferase type-2 subunit beta